MSASEHLSLPYVFLTKKIKHTQDSMRAKAFLLLRKRLTLLSEMDFSVSMKELEMHVFFHHVKTHVKVSHRLE